MKSIYTKIICLLAIILLISGCSSTTTEEPEVNSGVLDESYVGDPSPILEEDYIQTEEEAQLQADVLEKLEENGGSAADGSEINGRL